MQKNKEYFFSHDSNARGDIKIVKMRRELGWAGYGVFWALIEMMRSDNEYRLLLADLDTIAYELHYDEESLNKIVNNYGLFVIDNEHFYSRRLTNSMTKLNDFKERMSKAGKKGMKSRYAPKKEKPNPNQYI